MAREYRLPPMDPLAHGTRQKLRSIGNPRDICSGTLRLSLHLSEWEYDQLRNLNPDTLGHPDDKLRELYWRAFIDSGQAARFCVNERCN